MSVREQFDYSDPDVARFESDGRASCLIEGVDHLLEALREIHGPNGRPDIVGRCKDRASPIASP
jgi:hypothetical protein